MSCKTAECPVATAAAAQRCHLDAASPTSVAAQERAHAATRRQIERIQMRALEAWTVNSPKWHSEMQHSVIPTATETRAERSPAKVPWTVSIEPSWWGSPHLAHSWRIPSNFATAPHFGAARLKPEPSPVAP